MSEARWAQWEEAISEYGMLAKHPTTKNAIASPYVSMSQQYMKQVNQIWYQIFQIVKENYAELGFTAMPNVIDRVRNYVTITRLLEEKEIPGLDYLNYTMDHGALACVSKVIEVIKAENLDPDDPASVNNLQHAIIDSGYISSLDTNQLRDILALCKRYNEELKKDNLVQFADQEPLANKFLDAHPDYLASLTRSNVFAPARHLRVLWWLAMTLSPFTLSAIHRRIILSISLRKWV